MPYLRLRIRHHFLRAVLAQPQSVSVHVLVCRKDSVLLLQPGIGAGASLGARRVHPVSRAPQEGRGLWQHTCLLGSQTSSVPAENAGHNPS